jgi:hypothetical protein
VYDGYDQAADLVPFAEWIPDTAAFGTRVPA